MVISPDQYVLLLSSFRDEPAKISRAARVAHVSRPTARKGWNVGWPEKGLRPIREVVAEEQRAARAALTESGGIDPPEWAREDVYNRAWEEAEKARQDAIKNRRTEADMVRGARSNVMALLSTTGQLLRGAIQQARVLEPYVKRGIDPVTSKPIALKERIHILDKISRMVRSATESGVDVIQMERLLLGEPTEIIGTRDLDSISEEDAIRELEAAGKAAIRARERRNRRLKLVKGGLNGSGSGNGHAAG